MRRPVKESYDDIDGSKLAPEGRRIRFSLEGKHYEIDLNPLHVDQFRKIFRMYASRARRIDIPAKPSAADVRAWAEEQGMTVSVCGRIRESLVREYVESRDRTF